MIHSVFELGDTFVKEVMVPRTEVVFIERSKSLRQAMSLGLRSGFSRIPVIGENSDDVVGVVYLKDMMRRTFDHRESENDERVESLMRAPYFVPDSKPVDALLRDMQSARVHMAIAIDEYGGTAGLVTIAASSINGFSTGQLAALGSAEAQAATAKGGPIGKTASTITTRDGVEIYYKDWGPRTGQPVILSHGWPLSSDSWESAAFFLANNGFRVITHDRRGHGRSSQPWDGNDMDHYAADAAAVYEHLGLRNAIHIGHSTGGGEVVHYIARHGEDRVSKAAIISAVPPLMVQTPTNPGGLPKSVFDDLQAQLKANRAQFYHDVPAGPFYGYNRPGAKTYEGIVLNWWRQGMMGCAQAHYDGIVAFSQTDFTEDLKSIKIPVLVMHGDDDQIVPYENAGVLSAKLLQNSTLKIYPGFPHGMPTTNAETINADLLAFVRS